MIRGRRQAPSSSPNRDRWLISWADFITLLLALFIVLFATSRPDKHKARQVSYAVAEALHEANAAVVDEPVRATPPAPPAPQLKSSLDNLQRALAVEIRAGKVDVHLDNRGLVISLRQAAYFPSGGDEVAPEELDSLARIAEALRDIANPVQLEGHTDSEPIHNKRFRSNWELSAARSIAMLRLFEDRFGIAADRFAVAGYAETKPVDSNNSAEGRAHNRRVDIVILNR